MRSAATAETEISEGNWLLRDALWDRAERFLIGVLGTLAMLVGLVQVVGRYVAPRYAISWAEEVIVYLIVWGIMLAASQLVRTDGHVRADLVLRAAPARIQRWMEVINCIAALAFCAGLAWYGLTSSRPPGSWTSAVRRTYNFRCGFTRQRYRWGPHL